MHNPFHAWTIWRFLTLLLLGLLWLIANALLWDLIDRYSLPSLLKWGGVLILPLIYFLVLVPSWNKKDNEISKKLMRERNEERK